MYMYMYMYIYMYIYIYIYLYLFFEPYYSPALANIICHNCNQNGEKQAGYKTKETRKTT